MWLALNQAADDLPQPYTSKKGVQEQEARKSQQDLLSHTQGSHKQQWELLQMQGFWANLLLLAAILAWLGEVGAGQQSIGTIDFQQHFVQR